MKRINEIHTNGKRFNILNMSYSHAIAVIYDLCFIFHISYANGLVNWCLSMIVIVQQKAEFLYKKKQIRTSTFRVPFELKQLAVDDNKQRQSFI